MDWMKRCHFAALEHVFYLQQESALFREAEVIRYKLVGMAKDGADDGGLGQTGQQLFVEMNHDDSVSSSAGTKRFPSEKPTCLNHSAEIHLDVNLVFLPPRTGRGKHQSGEKCVSE